MGGSVHSSDDPEKNTTMRQNLPVDRDNSLMQPDLALTPKNPHDHEDDETAPHKIARRDLALEYKKNSEGEDQSRFAENGTEKNRAMRQNLHFDHAKNLMEPAKSTELANDSCHMTNDCDTKKVPSNVQNGVKQ